MRIIALIEDGQGDLHIVATRSPDLIRRESSAQTGTAQLRWVGLPPAGVSASSIVADATRALAMAASRGKPKTWAVAAKLLEHLCVRRPRRAERMQRLSRPFRRAGKRLKNLLVALERRLLPARRSANGVTATDRK